MRKSVKTSMSLGAFVVVCLIFASQGTATAKGKAPQKVQTTSTAKASPLIYSLSTTQEPLHFIGSYGVPAYVMVGGQARRGTYLSLVKVNEVGYFAGLKTGDVILSFNSRVAESPRVATEIARELSGDKVNIVFARKVNDRILVKEAQSEWTVANADSLPSPGYDSMQNYASQKSSPSSQKKESIEELESFMLQLINNDRSANGGLPQVRTSTVLHNMAREYANDMAKRNFFGHVDPDGKSIEIRAHENGIRNPISENLASSRSSSQLREMVKTCQSNMMNEAPNNPRNHRGTILNPDQKCVGIGVAILQNGGVVTVQEFSHDDLP